MLQVNSSAMADEPVGQMAMQHPQLLDQLQLLNGVKVVFLMELIPLSIKYPHIYVETIKFLITMTSSCTKRCVRVIYKHKYGRRHKLRHPWEFDSSHTSLR